MTDVLGPQATPETAPGGIFMPEVDIIVPDFVPDGITSETPPVGLELPRGTQEPAHLSQAMVASLEARRPSPDQIATARQELTALMQTEGAEARYVRGLNDLISRDPLRKDSTDAQFYKEHERLAGVANFAHDNIPSSPAATRTVISQASD